MQSSAASYCAVLLEDTIIPCRKYMAGKYHVDGDVLFAPLEMLHPWIKKSILLFTGLAEVPKVILPPCVYCGTLPEDAVRTRSICQTEQRFAVGNT
jgi:hypothetical protein